MNATAQCPHSHVREFTCTCIRTFPPIRHLLVLLGDMCISSCYVPLLARSYGKLTSNYLSRHVEKPTICIGENKGADQLRSNCEADQRLCFRYTDSTIPLFSTLNPKFQASSMLLCLYSLICVRPVRKPHCWFSHKAAHLL